MRQQTLPWHTFSYFKRYHLSDWFYRRGKSPSRFLVIEILLIMRYLSAFDDTYE